MSDTDAVRAIEAAVESLNDFMGEIHAGRVIGMQAECLRTRHVQFIHRVAEGAIAIALRKFLDLWATQIARELLAGCLPQEGVALAGELEQRRIRRFANLMVAHYSSKRAEPKITVEQRREILESMGFDASCDFYEWCGGAIESIEAVRDALVRHLEVVARAEE